MRGCSSWGREATHDVALGGVSQLRAVGGGEMGLGTTWPVCDVAWTRLKEHTAAWLAAVVPVTLEGGRAPIVSVGN